MILYSEVNALSINLCVNKNVNFRAGEIIQLLRTHAALEMDLSSTPSTHMVGH